MQTQKNKTKLYIYLIILVLFTVFNSYATEDNINSYQYLKIQINNNISFETELENNFKIDNFEIYSYFFPNTYNNSQYLNHFESTHKNYKLFTEENNTYPKFIFNENNLEQKNLIENNFVIEKTLSFPKIKTKQEYPITNIKEENKKYLKFSGFINQDENIKKQASSLASGEDDAYIIASKTAKWIKEDINYNLSTVAENPNQSSTDAFKSKSGVCREITNLYVSMLRSIGIPARVVTGYAYTNSEDVVSYVGSNWGGHAWAEVLIADTWVPFDLTYNQYGYVDATHIINEKSAESKNKGLSLNSSTSGVELISDSIKTNTKFNIIDKKYNSFDEGFDINLSGITEIGFDSYGYIKVSIKNKDDFYKVLFLKISKPNEIELLDKKEKMIIFHPNETKEIYFRYKIPTLDSKYIYTLPFVIYNDFFQINFNVTTSNTYQKILKASLPEDEKTQITYSQNKPQFDCNYILDSPNNILICSIQNINNYEINNMNVCITTKCEKISLKINEIKSITFYTEKFGEKISYSTEKETGDFDLKIDKPEINCNYNQNITSENILINVAISNYIQNLNVTIYNNNSKNLIQKLNNQNENIQIKLNEGINEIKCELSYKGKLLSDSKLNITYEKKTFTKAPIETTKKFFEKILNYILNLF